MACVKHDIEYYRAVFTFCVRHRKKHFFLLNVSTITKYHNFPKHDEFGLNTE